jgi:hypothetical protein
MLDGWLLVLVRGCFGNDGRDELAAVLPDSRNAG